MSTCGLGTEVLWLKKWPLVKLSESLLFLPSEGLSALAKPTTVMRVRFRAACCLSIGYYHSKQGCPGSGYTLALEFQYCHRKLCSCANGFWSSPTEEYPVIPLDLLGVIFLRLYYLSNCLLGMDWIKAQSYLLFPSKGRCPPWVV